MDIYLIAIGGTGVAPLACLLKQIGHAVRGADGPLYPPMSTLLAAEGIVPHVGYDPAHLEPRPELVVVGNAVPRTNPEAEETERLGVERISMPQALARFFLGHRRPLVVAGTHGKTTTTALASWVYLKCGADPGFLIGGIPQNLERNFRLGQGARFIIEGDEYNAAYFDRGPKFFHYRAQTLILTSVEYDHADLYPDPSSLVAVYRKLVESLPADGLLIACGDSPEVRQVAAGAPCRTIFYGLESDNDIHPLRAPITEPAGSRFTLDDPEAGRIELRMGLGGDHNVQNALAVWAAARADGFSAEDVGRALASFAGVKRRQELIGRPLGIAVIDDFAHHPTAVAKTLDALRGRFPSRRLVAAFEPRSLTTSRKLFFDEYSAALARADRVYLAPVFYADRFDEDEKLDLEALAGRLSDAATPAFVAKDLEELASRLIAEARPGDVLVTMSSGSFDGLPQRLVKALAEPRPS